MTSAIASESAPSWHRQCLTVARFALLEAARTRLALYATGTLLCLTVGALFVEQVAITEGARLRTVALASSCRLVLAAMLCQHVVASIVRELNDGAVQFALAVSMPRGAFYLGKMLAFCTIAAMVAALAGAALLGSADPARIAGWTALLIMELSIVTAVALFCALGTRQTLPAMLLCGGFYCLARTVAALERLTAAPIESHDGAFALLCSVCVRIMSLVLPDLSHFANTTWLVDRQAGGEALRAAALQTLIYLALAGSAGIHDLKRRDF